MKNINNCLLCNSQNTIIYQRDIIQCNNCSNFFRINVSDDIYKKYENKLQMPSFFDSRLKALHHINFIEQNIDMKKVYSILEVGSGNGVLIKEIRVRFPKKKITIIEPGKEFIKKLKLIPNVTVLNSYIEKSDINKKFDLVIMSHVLEHLKKPTDNLIYIYKTLLNKGGVLYIDIPNSDFELRSINASNAAPKIHLSFFSPKGIAKVLKTCGFREGSISGCIYSTLPHIWIKNQSEIGRMSSLSNKSIMRLSIIKISNRITLMFSSLLAYFFRVKPKEKTLDEFDGKYNNIAILAQK